MTNEKIKYKVFVYENGQYEVRGARDEELELVTIKDPIEIQFPNLKGEPILEYDLGNPRVVCVCGRCWMVP